jgi:hypothetical protein
MADAEHVHIQLRTRTQRNLQSNSQSGKYMALKAVSAANEVAGYAQLQQQIHDALRAQHPEWLQPNGDSPTCEAYESRFVDLLRILARDAVTRNAPEFSNSATDAWTTAKQRNDQRIALLELAPRSRQLLQMKCLRHIDCHCGKAPRPRWAHTNR